MEIIGHAHILKYLARIAHRGEMPHAMLFYGPSHVGKFTIAKDFIRLLHCRNPIHAPDCTTCISCVNISKERHPDVLVIRQEGEISISQIREIQQFLATSPFYGTKKSILIDHAHTLTSEAAHALLKTVEEPPPHAIFILVTHIPRRLPQTLLSRLMHIRFSFVAPLLIETLIKRFPSLSNRDKLAIMELSDGRPGLALLLLDDRTFFARCCRMKEEVRRIWAMNLEQKFAFQHAIVKDASTLLFLDLCMSSTRKKIRDQLSQQSYDFPIMHALDFLKFLLKLRNLFETFHISPERLVTLVMLKIHVMNIDTASLLS